MQERPVRRDYMLTAAPHLTDVRRPTKGIDSETASELTLGLEPGSRMLRRLRHVRPV